MKVQKVLSFLHCKAERAKIHVIFDAIFCSKILWKLFSILKDQNACKFTFDLVLDFIVFFCCVVFSSVDLELG